MSAIDIVGVVFAAIGASFFLSAFVPQFRSTHKTKNTVGINKTMFILHLAVGLLFFYGAVFLTIQGMNGNGNGWPLISQGAIFAVLNFIGSMGSLYTVLLKNQNKKEAESMGITEEEHYQRYCASREVLEEGE